MLTEQNKRQLEILKEEAQKRIARDYSSFYTDAFVMVDPKLTRLVIDDISYRAQSPTQVQEYIEFLLVACKGKAQCFDAAKLTQALASKVDRLLTTLNRRRTAVIFPGNGSQVLKDLLPDELLEDTTLVNATTQRIINPQTRAVESVTILDALQVRQKLLKARPETVLVLDDVIATGFTLTALRKTLDQRNAEWFAASLMSLSPLQRRGKVKNALSGVEGYNVIISPLVYQGISGTPSLNSLSTLVSESEKGNIVRSRYLQAYVADTEIFTESVQKIRNNLL